MKVDKREDGSVVICLERQDEIDQFFGLCSYSPLSDALPILRKFTKVTKGAKSNDYECYWRIVKEICTQPIGLDELWNLYRYTLRDISRAIDKEIHNERTNKNSLYQR